MCLLVCTVHFSLQSRNGCLSGVRHPGDLPGAVERQRRRQHPQLLAPRGVAPAVGTLIGRAIRVRARRTGARRRSRHAALDRTL